MSRRGWRKLGWDRETSARRFQAWNPGTVRRPRWTLDLRRPLCAPTELAEIPGFSRRSDHLRGRLLNEANSKGTLGGKRDGDAHHG